MQLELTPDEAKILHETLVGEISELGMEIADTDQKDFRDALKKKKAVLGHLVRALELAA